MTTTAPFVIIVLCAQATLDHLIHEQKKHKAIVVDVFQYKKDMDYLAYRDRIASVQEMEIIVMFIFGRHDSVLVRDNADVKDLQERLDKGDCHFN
ncbi:hypothetical protein ACTHGU_17140 [Chitinophagaceae bacterium MMS25-I14]